jgi:hypothetical protein
MRLRSIWYGWNKFWFQPSSPAPLGLFRIWLGFILLQDALLMRIGDWRIFYSTHPLIPLTTFMKFWWGREPRFDLIAYLPTDEMRLGLLYLYVLFIIFMILGLYTRASCLGALLINESMFNHFTLNISGADVFLKITLLIITFSNAGDAFSVDNLRRALREDWRQTGFKPPLKPQWALRMLQLQVCLVYALTVHGKIPGPQWLDGSAIYYVTRSEDFTRFDVPFLLNNMWTLRALTWGTLLFEFCFFWMVWIKELRYPILFVAVLFHLGLEWTCNIPIFELIFIGSFITFIAPEDLSRVMDFVKFKLIKTIGLSQKILFNPNSIEQIRLTGLIHRMDIFGLLSLSSQMQEGGQAQSVDSIGSIELVTKEGKLSGFEAFRCIVQRLPLAWPVLPFLFLPIFSAISRRLFEMLSKHADRKVQKTQYSRLSEDRHHFKLLYWRLVLLMIIICLVCLGNLPEQIYLAQNLVSRTEELNTTGRAIAKRLEDERKHSASGMLKSLDDLGWNLFQQNNQADAEKTLLEALHLAESNLGASYNNQYAQSLLSLAVFNRDRNNFQESNIYFSRLQDYDAKYISAPSAVIARDFANLSLNAYLQGSVMIDVDECNKILEHALSLCNRAELEYSKLPGCQRLIGNVLSTKYLVLRDLGKVEDAESAKHLSSKILQSAKLKTIEP